MRVGYWLLAIGFWGTACATAGPPGSGAPSSGAARPALAAADSLRAEVVAPGVTYTYAWRAEGPWAIHALEVDPDRCTLRAAKAGPPLDERATTSALAREAVAGINADFFYIPRGATVGAHVTGGVIVTGPAARPVFAVREGDPWIGRLTLNGSAATPRGALPIRQINKPGALALYTPWIGHAVPADTLGWRAGVVVRLLQGGAYDGRGVVVTIDSVGGPLPLGRDRVALAAADTAVRRTLLTVAAGDTVAWRVAATPAVDEAVGGYVMLVEGGAIAAEAGGTSPFFTNRHPRTAVGITPSGTVLLVAVDGRQPPHSDGMTLLELAALMGELGAETALNLDGGGSTALVTQGRVRNRPSDKEGERPVGNALVVERCR